MSPEKINKVISTYMKNAEGLFKYQVCYKCEEYEVSYTDSIDMLIPVWERLGLSRIDLRIFNNDTEVKIDTPMVIINDPKVFISGEIDCEDLQFAAALATAKAIVRLT